MIGPRALIARVLFLIAFVLVTHGYAGAKDNLDRLMESCSAGDQKACQEIEQIVEANKSQLEKLNQRADSFQAEHTDLAIQVGNHPNLKKAYSIIIKDYFASDAIGPLHRKRGFTKKLLDECSQRFHEFWINQRKEWPTLPAGKPDWSTIYLQVLDHYFRFCSK